MQSGTGVVHVLHLKTDAECVFRCAIHGLLRLLQDHVALMKSTNGQTKMKQGFIAKHFCSY